MKKAKKMNDMKEFLSTIGFKPTKYRISDGHSPVELRWLNQDTLSFGHPNHNL